MGTGTDVAMSSAQVTLVKGDLRGIVRAKAFGKPPCATCPEPGLRLLYTRWECRLPRPAVPLTGLLPVTHAGRPGKSLTRCRWWACVEVAQAAPGVAASRLGTHVCTRCAQMRRACWPMLMIPRASQMKPVSVSPSWSAPCRRGSRYGCLAAAVVLPPLARRPPYLVWHQSGSHERWRRARVRQ